MVLLQSGNWLQEFSQSTILKGPEGALDYFLRIGLYPSLTRRVRMASAALMSAKGPTCTREYLSMAEFVATNAGYCFFFRASTKASASSDFVTAATWT